VGEEYMIHKKVPAEFSLLQKRFSDHYRQGRIQEAVSTIFKALEIYSEHPERPNGYDDLQSNDVRPGYLLERSGLITAQSFLSLIGPHHLFGRTKRLANCSAFLDQALSLFPDTLLLAALKTVVLLDQDNPIEALTQARATLNIKAHSPLAEHLLEKVVKRLASRQLQTRVEFNNFEKALLSDLRPFFCQMPFTNFEVINNGDVYVCCGGFLPAPIGNIFRHSYEEIWNSETAQKIRRSVLTGDFTYCSRSCELIRGQVLPRKSSVKDPGFREYIDLQQTYIKEGPRYLNMAHDYTCNLYCPSCRRKPRVADAAMLSRLEDAWKRVVEQVLPHVYELQIAGDGDPFASRHYRAVLSSLDSNRHPHLRLRILTNGVLFTPKAWETFANIHPLLETVQVSVDAATEKTYAMVRRGGDFTKVLENLRFLAQKRAEKAFDCLQLNFVVQKKNYFEMPDFVHLGKEIGVDRIVFQHLHNQLESFDAGEFQEANIFSPDHPSYNHLLALLADPIFTSKKPVIVLPELGTQRLQMKFSKDAANHLIESKPALHTDRTGWWWMPGHGGVGIAVQDDFKQLHVGITSFRDDGRPVWHECVAVRNGDDFQGDLLLKHYDSQRQVYVSQPGGLLRLSFCRKDRGTICIQKENRTFESEIAPYMQDNTDHQGVRGWYRTPDGRNAMLFIELREGAVTGGLFFFQKQGDPSWLAFREENIAHKTTRLKTSLFAYENGEVLGRDFQPAQEKKVGEMELDLSDHDELKCSGWIEKRYA